MSDELTAHRWALLRLTQQEVRSTTSVEKLRRALLAVLDVATFYGDDVPTDKLLAALEKEIALSARDKVYRSAWQVG